MSNFINFKSAIGSADETLRNLEEEITHLFIQNYTFKYKSKAEKVLKNYVKVNSFTESESFYLGFFIGLLLVICKELPTEMFSTSLILKVQAVLNI